MQGLFVAGTAADAGEPAVAAALCTAARAGGPPPRAFVASATGPGRQPGLALLAEATGDGDALARRSFETAAPPAVAARHAGASIEPATLVDEARTAADGARFLVAVTSGGLLAPLAERYLNRDLAVELRLPVVLAAPAAEGLVNGALLAVEAARGAGLAVAALVISGWPDAPPRVLLDERALLERRSPAPVLALPAAARSADALHQAAGGWPVGDWLAAAPAAPPAGGEDAAAPAAITLEPYQAWEDRPVGDPRQTPRSEIMAAILEIAAAEGPMRASRAYALYNRASGGRKLTSVARAPLSSAVYWLAQEHRLLLTRRDDIPWQDDDLIRLPDTAPVRVRELGPRTLEEVPLDEIAELAGRLRSARGIGDATEMKRAILGVYSLVRLTARADEYLGLALDLEAG
jgi:dethiobiotin synthetase